MKAQKSQNSTKTKKPPLRQRLGDTLTSLDEVRRNPRSAPGKAHGWFRRWFRKLWEIRGGGLYALGYIVTFAYLEVTTFTSELIESTSVSGFVGAQVFEFFFRFLSDSIANMIKAFMWPVWIVQLNPPFGAIAFGLAFVGFARFVKPRLEVWIFGDEPETVGADPERIDDKV